MTSTTSTLSFFDLSDMDGSDKKKKKDKDNFINAPVRRLKAKKVTVQGDPGAPPKVGNPLSQSGIMVPYLIGRQRIFQPNAVWYGNLDLMYETETEVISREVNEVQDDGETALQPVTTIQETNYISGYRLDVHLGLCLGPDVHLREIYLDGAKKWQGDASGARTVISSGAISDDDFWADFIFYNGRFNQTFNGGEIVGVNPPGYVGIAMLSISGANATDVFPQISVELERHPNPLVLSGANNVDANGDINPMTAAADVITNTWGGASVGIGYVDEVTFTAAAVRLAAEGNFISIYNQEVSSAAEILEEIENQCLCKFHQDPETQIIRVQLIRYDLYDFDTCLRVTDSNMSVLRDFVKSSWAGAASRSAASFTNRSKDYDEDLLVALSPNVSGSSRDEETARYDYPLSMNATVASKCLARDMIIMNQPTWSGEIQGNRQMADLVPGDCFLLTSPEYNVEDLPCVVNTRSDIAQDVGVLISFEEIVNPNGTVLYAIPEPSLFVPVDKSPQSPTEAMVISAPYWIQVWAGYTDRIWTKRIKVCTPLYLVEAYNRTQVSFDVRMLNYPNIESATVGQMPTINRAALYASVGQLVSEIDEIDGWAKGIISSLNINGVVRPQYIKPTGTEGVREGSIWAFIEDEILSFEFAEDIGGGVWTLENVHRGLLDTAPAYHPAGTKVWIINGNWTDRIGMSFDIEPDFIPELLFCSVTVNEKQKDEGLLYTDWTPDGRVNKPLRPVATKIDASRGTGSPVNLARSSTHDVGWKTRSRNKIKKVALFADAAHPPEVANNGTWQTHDVYLVDSADVEWDLGGTTPSPADANLLNVTIPAGAAVGVGYIYVQAVGAFGKAIQAEHFAVNIT